MTRRYGDPGWHAGAGKPGKGDPTGNGGGKSRYPGKCRRVCRRGKTDESGAEELKIDSIEKKMPEKIKQIQKRTATSDKLMKICQMILLFFFVAIYFEEIIHRGFTLQQFPPPGRDRPSRQPLLLAAVDRRIHRPGMRSGCPDISVPGQQLPVRGWAG